MATICEKYGQNRVGAYPPNKAIVERKTQSVVESSELIGIEVEVEAAANRGISLNRVWSTKEDNSLRNGGCEFVSQPIMARHAPAALEHLMNDYLDMNICCFSPRTSVHIHLNMQDMTPDQCVDYIMLYSIFEKQLYKFVGKNRRKNVFCVPLADTTMLMSLAEYGETRQRAWAFHWNHSAPLNGDICTALRM
jgi:hypothetical protein